MGLPRTAMECSARRGRIQILHLCSVSRTILPRPGAHKIYDVRTRTMLGHPSTLLPLVDRANRANKVRVRVIPTDPSSGKSFHLQLLATASLLPYRPVWLWLTNKQ